MLPRLTAGLRSQLPSFAFLSSMVSSNISPANPQNNTIQQLVDDTIATNQVVIFSKSWCMHCKRVKNLFASEFPSVKAAIFELDLREDGSAIQSYLSEKTGQHTVPSVFVNKKHIGGGDDTHAAFRIGRLTTLLKTKA